MSHAGTGGEWERRDDERIRELEIEVRALRKFVFTAIGASDGGITMLGLYPGCRDKARKEAERDG